MRDNRKGSKKELRNTDTAVTARKVNTVRIGKFEILFEKQGNIVKIINIIEDLSEEHKILSVDRSNKLRKTEDSKHCQKSYMLFNR